MQERFDAGEIVEARVIDHNKGGLIVDLGMRGFVPISQIVDFPRRPRDEQPRDAAQEIAEKLQPFVGRTLRLKILEVNRKANRLILSEKVALYEERREKRDELFSSLETGQKVTGNVRSIAPFGVFVDLGGIDGLVHKSELSWNKVNNPETAHQIGDEVEAEVIDINHERGRISLSIRRLQPDPVAGVGGEVQDRRRHRRHRDQARQLRRVRARRGGPRGPDPHQRAVQPARRPSRRRRPGGPAGQAADHQPRLRAPSPGPQPEAGRGSPGTVARRTPRGSAATRPWSAPDRFDYRPEDATAEPEGGIDNTMAAAFASSGLLEQLRSGQDEASAEAEAAEAPRLGSAGAGGGGLRRARCRGRDGRGARRGRAGAGESPPKRSEAAARARGAGARGRGPRRPLPRTAAEEPAAEVAEAAEDDAKA
jgi:predicted RNA-binding protein with RPS1 domain